MPKVLDLTSLLTENLTGSDFLNRVEKTEQYAYAYLLNRRNLVTIALIQFTVMHRA